MKFFKIVNKISTLMLRSYSTRTFSNEMLAIVNKKGNLINAISEELARNDSILKMLDFLRSLNKSKYSATIVNIHTDVLENLEKNLIGTDSYLSGETFEPFNALKTAEKSVNLVDDFCRLVKEDKSFSFDANTKRLFAKAYATYAELLYKYNLESSKESILREVIHKTLEFEPENKIAKDLVLTITYPYVTTEKDSPKLN